MGNGLFGNFGRKMNTSLANMDPRMMMMAAQLLNNSGRSTQRRGLMQGMPEAIMAGQQMQRQNEAYKRQQDEYARQKRYSSLVAAAVAHDPQKEADRLNLMSGARAPAPQPEAVSGPPAGGLQQSLATYTPTPVKPLPYDLAKTLTGIQAEHGGAAGTDAVVQRALAAPKSIPITTNAAGYKVYNRPGTPEHGTRVFPGAEKPADTLTNAQMNKNNKIREARKYMESWHQSHDRDELKFDTLFNNDLNYNASLARQKIMVVGGGVDPDDARYQKISGDPTIVGEPEERITAALEYDRAKTIAGLKANFKEAPPEKAEQVVEMIRSWNLFTEEEIATITGRSPAPEAAPAGGGGRQPKWIGTPYDFPRDQ
jgi:hypothetical protein